MNEAWIRSRHASSQGEVGKEEEVEVEEEEEEEEGEVEVVK